MATAFNLLTAGGAKFGQRFQSDVDLFNRVSLAHQLRSFMLTRTEGQREVHTKTQEIRKGRR